MRRRALYIRDDGAVLERLAAVVEVLRVNRRGSRVTPTEIARVALDSALRDRRFLHSLGLSLAEQAALSSSKHR